MVYALIVSRTYGNISSRAVDVCDGKGEKLHQLLMPKKMQKLNESTDYRPFKFRIQAFTNAFHDEVGWFAEQRLPWN